LLNAWYVQLTASQSTRSIAALTTMRTAGVVFPKARKNVRHSRQR